MRRWRYASFAVALAFIILPLVPLPFWKPRILHDVLGGFPGGLISITCFAFLFLCIFTVFGWFAIVSAKQRKVDGAKLIEFAFLSCMLLFSLFAVTFSARVQPRVIYWLNEHRDVQDFVNPYLGFKMYDCRNVTDEFDVIFVPAHIDIETQYLAYAPRRLDKSQSGYRFGEKYGDNWYWDTSGSIWGGTPFGDCVLTDAVSH